MCCFDSPTIGPHICLSRTSEEPDISKNNDVQQAAPTFDNAMEELDLECCINRCETPAGFSITQTFPLHILYQLSTFPISYVLND